MINHDDTRTLYSFLNTSISTKYEPISNKSINIIKNEATVTFLRKGTENAYSFTNVNNGGAVNKYADLK